MKTVRFLRLAACATGLGMALSVPAQDKPAAAARPALTVTTVQPQSQVLPQVLLAHGSIAAWQEALVGAEANGLKLVEVKVNVGDVVARGDLLALLQSDTLRAELVQSRALLAEAEAAAQEARAQAERSRSLQQQGFFSNAQLSAAQASEAVAQARVQSARAAVGLGELRLAQTEVRAPDAGVISARQATLGAVVGAGSELFRRFVRAGSSGAPRSRPPTCQRCAPVPRCVSRRPADWRSVAGCGCWHPRLIRRPEMPWSMWTWCVPRAQPRH